MSKISFTNISYLLDIFLIKASNYEVEFWMIFFFKINKIARSSYYLESQILQINEAKHYLLVFNR